MCYSLEERKRKDKEKKGQEKEEIREGNYKETAEHLHVSWLAWRRTAGTGTVGSTSVI